MSESTLEIPIMCTLCGKKFYGPTAALGTALLLGETSPKAARLIQELAGHVGTKHKKEFRLYTQQQAEYFGLQILRVYVSNDEAFQKSIDELRWKIHNATRRVVVTDERIKERVAKRFEAMVNALAGVTPEEIEALRNVVCPEVEGILKEMRDVFQEIGRYKDAPDPESIKLPGGTEPQNAVVVPKPEPQ